MRHTTYSITPKVQWGWKPTSLDHQILSWSAIFFFSIQISYLTCLRQLVSNTIGQNSKSATIRENGKSTRRYKLMSSEMLNLSVHVGQAAVADAWTLWSLKVSEESHLPFPAVLFLFFSFCVSVTLCVGKRIVYNVTPSVLLCVACSIVLGFLLWGFCQWLKCWWAI